MAEFSTITGDDWARSLVKARERRLDAGRRMREVVEASESRLVGRTIHPVEMETEPCFELPDLGSEHGANLHSQ